MEVWNDVKNFEGYYQISDQGRLKSVARTIVRSNGVHHRVRERIIKCGTNPKGYLIAQLSKNCQSSLITVHRLVLSTFKNESELQVNHINGNIQDNRLLNLEYVTNVENMNHRYTDFGNKKKYGVTFDKARGLWSTGISVNGKRINLGRFDCKNEAYEAFYWNYLKYRGVAPW